MKVAIQGIKGSFHHIVAKSYFSEEIELVECMTFSEMPKLLVSGKVDALIMAIENSIAASILPNYALIDQYQLNIIGEYHLNIAQNLMCLKGQNIEDIKEVYSHPMALLQCAKFFENYPHIKLIEDKDTAEVARRIHENKLSGVGAIASSLAANIYDLEIIGEGIQTIKNNATRFFVLDRNEEVRFEEGNKASIRFTASHEAGSLGGILTAFGNNNVSLSKIQSMPVIETPWRYAFFADLIFDKYEDYENSLNDIAPLVQSIKIIGEYKKSKR
ncbi:prephenate dehydratase [Urechidicola vernalis]|uniref:prephenate dehydratase n=1 Tax=Urechidicola vernalis TaxID=3075600 RepID=A0ABU2Y5M5_9FLAO|nr:prephenate dehydratase [Urechidicola sp. P050]MDT0553486.1 prephenate dehydratase [Urechidicola sp. P050]